MNTFERSERLKLLREEVGVLDARIDTARRDLRWLERLASEKRYEINELLDNGAAAHRSLDAIIR